MVDMGFHFFDDEMLAAAEEESPKNKGKNDVAFSSDKDEASQSERDTGSKDTEEF